MSAGMTAGQADRFREWLRLEKEHEGEQKGAALDRGDVASAHYLEGRADAFRSALIAFGCAEVGALFLRGEEPAP